MRTGIARKNYANGSEPLGMDNFSVPVDVSAQTVYRSPSSPVPVSMVFVKTSSSRSTETLLKCVVS